MFMELITLFFRNYYDILIAAIIMVSALIVVIGALKPILFDKIPNSLVRKIALSFTNVLLSFASVAVAFLVHEISFSYYLFSAIVFTVLSIIVYWLYENTGLRNLIHKIGSLTIGKVINVITLKFKKEDTDVLAELNAVSKDLSKTTKNEIATKADEELKGL